MPRVRQPKQVIEPSDMALAPGPLRQPLTILRRIIAHNSKVKTHSHPWGQLIYSDVGVMSVKTNHTQCIVSPHQAIWVPPSMPHQVTALSQVSLSSLYVELTELEGLPSQCCVLEIDLLTRLLIRKASEQTADGTWEGKEGRLLRVLRDSIADCQPVALHLPLPDDLGLVAIIEQLQRHPDDSRSLAQWGNIVGASPRTLARKFRRETGLTFSEWKQRLKVQRAIELLNKGMSVTAVALELGYESTSAFIFMFKSHLGESPGRFLSSRDKR